MKNISKETHPFEPFVPANAKILILGTFPPSENRWSMEFYYPNWINDMWRIMGIIFFGNKDIFCDIPNKTFHLDQLKVFLNANRIALYDTGREISRLKGNASDKYLEIHRPVDIQKFLNQNPSCEALATTGEKAAAIISELTNSDLPKIGEFVEFDFGENRKIKHFRMPSTSRAYPLSIIKKAEFYGNMFKELGYNLFSNNA